MSLTRQLAVPPPVSDPNAVDDPEAAEYRQHIGELDALLAAATADDPIARPTLGRLAKQLADWEDGIKFRDEFHAYAIQSQEDEELVLRWLVSTLRRDRSLGLNVYDVRDAASESPIDGMKNTRFSNAVEGLVGSYKAAGDRFPPNGEPWHWNNVYPTSYGIEQIERERVQIEALPLLRTIMKNPVDMLSFSGADEAVAFGDAEMPASELYYLLRYMKDASLVDFDQQWVSGPGVIILHVKLTSIGRMRVGNAAAVN